MQIQDPSQRKQAALAQALPAYIDLIANWTQMTNFLHEIITSPGELGAVMNLEQLNMPDVITKNGVNLTLLIGTLPPSAILPISYTGSPRVNVPSPRSSILK